MAYPQTNIAFTRTSNTTHYVFNANTIIQRVRVGDMRVRLSYAMSLHKTELRNSNHVHVGDMK